METGVDWDVVNRLDDALIIQFLSGGAAALKETGSISQLESDELRIGLQGNRDTLEGEGPLLVRLEKQRNRFLKILTHRYSEVGLALNITRYTIRPLLFEFKKSLALSGQKLMAKSELLLNRTLYQYVGGRCSRQVLFSSMILDVSEAFQEGVETIYHLEKELQVMLPSFIAPYSERDLAIDNSLAKHLDFSTCETEQTPFKREKNLNRQIAHTLLAITDATTSFLEQCGANHMTKIRDEALPHCEWLRAEGLRLHNLGFPYSSSLAAWELRRQNYFHSLIVIQKALEGLTGILLGSLTVDALDSWRAEALPDSARRFLLSDLVLTGADLEMAEKAVDKLSDYCLSKGVTTKDMLPEEFVHIHPALKKEALLELKKEAPHASSKLSATGEKKRLLQRMTKLSQKFRKVIESSALVILLLGVLPLGCGVKIPPKSDLEVLRPEIPYKPSKETQAAKVSEDALPGGAKKSKDVKERR